MYDVTVEGGSSELQEFQRQVTWIQPCKSQKELIRLYPKRIKLQNQNSAP